MKIGKTPRPTIVSKKEYPLANRAQRRALAKSGYKAYKEMQKIVAIRKHRELIKELKANKPVYHGTITL